MLSDGLLGALIGGGATVIVSGITNYFVVRNLGKQQEHDAKQKAEDRKASLRREVYLKVVEGIHALHADMGNIQNRALDDGNSEAFQNLLQSTAKMWIVSEYETTVLSREYVNVISEGYMAAMVQSGEVRTAVAHMEETKQIARDARTTARAAEQALDRGNSDFAGSADLQSLVVDFTEKSEWASTTMHAHDEAVRVSLPLRRAHSQLVFSHIRRGNPFFVKLVAALRNEIGLKSDEAAFMKLIQEQEKRAAAAFAAVFPDEDDETEGPEKSAVA